jgi:hypothetical protein
VNLPERDDAPATTGANVKTTINRHRHPTGAVRLSLPQRRLLAEQFDPDTLRHLACLMEAEHPRVRARRSLSPEGVDRLAEIVGNGSTPTVGFFKRWAA